MALTVTSQNFDTEVMNSDKPVLIDFWASWCGPCKMMSPIIDQLSTELEEKVKVAKVNVDDEPEIASQFNIMSIPTLVMIKDGKVSASAVGARPKDDLLKQLGI